MCSLTSCCLPCYAALQMGMMGPGGMVPMGPGSMMPGGMMPGGMGGGMMPVMMAPGMGGAPGQHMFMVRPMGPGQPGMMPMGPGMMPGGMMMVPPMSSPGNRPMMVPQASGAAGCGWGVGGESGGGSAASHGKDCTCHALLIAQMVKGITVPVDSRSRWDWPYADAVAFIIAFLSHHPAVMQGLMMMPPMGMGPGMMMPGGGPAGPAGPGGHGTPGGKGEDRD
jgi:hypothetical protein